MLRITPAGTPILKLAIDCGVTPEQMRVDVVMPGDQCLEAARRIRRDRPVRVVGRLRTVGTGIHAAIEVVAASIEAENDD